MKTYEQWELDELLEKEVSITTGDGDNLAIYRLAAISPEKGITLKFVRRIGGTRIVEWGDCCLNLDHHNAARGPGQAHFSWMVKAIQVGHFDLAYYYIHFKIPLSGSAAACAF